MYNTAGPRGAFWEDPSPYHVPYLPLVCRKTLASQAFPRYQRVSLIRSERMYKKGETVKQDKIIVYPLNQAKII